MRLYLVVVEVAGLGLRRSLLQLVAAHVDVAGRNDISIVRDALQVAVYRISDAGQEVEQAARRLLVRLLEVEDDGAAVYEIELMTKEHHYEYEISGSTSQVLESEQKKR